MALSQKKTNTLLGWIVFAAASLVYILTTEPTASLWDCPEYIATAVKLEVGHPPGAPMFQMLGAVVGNAFAMSPSQLGYVMNIWAALAGGASIMLLFWITTYFVRRVFGKAWGELSRGDLAAVLGSALIGSAAILFSDTFWFNATESEVYSLATCATVAVFYFAVRWEQGFGEPRNNKWLLLIALMLGMGPGVHFMVLLAIPAVVLIYYFKTHEKITTKNFIFANLLAFGILGIVFIVLFPLLISTFGNMELFFVNGLGLPFNSGTIFAALFIVALLAGAVWFTQRKGYKYLNTIALSVSFIVIGFSCFMMVVVRANARTAINENDPSDAVSLLSYFNRDQYGSNSLFYGPVYNSEVDWNDPYKSGKPIYEKNLEQRRYEIVDSTFDYNFLPGHLRLLPRMANPGNAKNYSNIAGLDEGELPSLSDNLGFMFSYQFGYMYFRYFMWNFAGRQNDIQGNLEPTKGNWISGIKWLDESRLGPQDGMPDYLANNPARNAYFLLPFLLGLLGFVFHYLRRSSDWYVLLIFFLMTGLAITFYTNNPPFEPRERDYALVVSFWTFGIWIGLGVTALYMWLKKWLKGKNEALAAVSLCAVCFALVPARMGAENWDDHDRSHRRTAEATGVNYLESVAPDAILVTYGDNDTFPLWYMQEVEGIRTDVKVVNTSLLQADWYIDQMKEKYHEDEMPLDISFVHNQYREGVNDYVYYKPNTVSLADSVLDISTFIELIKRRPEQLLHRQGTDKAVMTYPTRKIRIPVNKENALKYGIVEPKDSALIVDEVVFEIGESLGKNDLVMLDILANLDWKRPIYFGIAGGGGGRNYSWLTEYLQLEGLAYKFVPIKSFPMSRTSADRGYESIKKWKFGNMGKDGVYLTETDRRLNISLRQAMVKTASALLEQGDTLRAKEIINLTQEQLPIQRFEPFYYTVDMLAAMYRAGEKQQAEELSAWFLDQLEKESRYYMSFPDSNRSAVYRDLLLSLDLYKSMLEMLREFNRPMFTERIKVFEDLVGA